MRALHVMCSWGNPLQMAEGVKKLYTLNPQPETLTPKPLKPKP